MASSKMEKSSLAGIWEIGPTARIEASISMSAGEMMRAPAPPGPPRVVPKYTLKPLSSGGLWLAVIMTPAHASSARTAWANTGVGSTRGKTSARRPAPAATRAVSSANAAEWRRPS